MQFQVPQFIESEDKVVGPFSLRQFAYVGAAGVVSAFLYFLTAPWLWVIGSLIVFGFALALAFIKIEGRPFANVLLSAFNFYWKPQTYVWQPEHTAVALPKATVRKESGPSLENILAEAAPKKRVFPILHPAPAAVTQPAKPVEPATPAVVAAASVTRESVSLGSTLHRIWENVQTGEPLAKKNSDKQYLEKKMEERYQIFQRISGDRNAAKRIDYR